MNSVHYRRAAKKAVCFLIIAVLSVGSFGNLNVDFDARAASISEMQNEINALDSKMDGLQDKIDSLQGDIDEKQEYLDTINSYISAVENKIMTSENLLSSYAAEINDLNGEIADKEEELAENKELFKRRIRSIYMSGGSSNNLLVLLGADQFADYLSTAQVSESLANYDNALIKKISLAMKSINKKIDKKNVAIDEQKEIKAQLASERADLQGKQSEANKIKNSIVQSQDQLKSELAAAESAKADLEARVDAAYEAARQQALAGNSVQYDGNGFAWPIPGYTNLTSPFGMRFDPYYQYYRGHNGIDISGGGIAGKPVVASATGTVTMAEFNNGGYGNYVVISHGDVNGNLVTTHYAHLMSYAVSVGQTVNQGDVIGYVGTTGASTGYHLHFEVRTNNTPVNPFGYVSY